MVYFILIGYILGVGFAFTKWFKHVHRYDDRKSIIKLYSEDDITVTEHKSESSRCFTSSLDGLYIAPVGLKNDDLVKGYLIGMETMAYTFGLKYEFIPLVTEED